MILIDSLRIALTALATNLLRSLLTTLGIIIGVAAVIVMVAIGTGARSEVDRQINSLGTNILMVWPGSSRVMGRMAGAGTNLPLSEGEMQLIRERVPGIVAISGAVSGGAAVVNGNTNWTTTVTGVHEGYLDARDWLLTEGRNFTTQDIRSQAKVAILGVTVARQLFGEGNPVGSTIRVRNIPFLVIGLLEAKGSNSFGRDQDDLVLVPISTGRGRIVGRNALVPDSVGQLQIKMDGTTPLAEAKEEIEQLLRTRRRPLPGGDDSFTVRDPAEFLRARTAAMTTLGLLLAATSAIALIVGGIGIMNIMLVSVTERTREIGLRLAVGARRRDILVQFLVEAVMLCLAGGIVGVGLGLLCARIAAGIAEWPMLISPGIVALAMAAAAATGIFFGYFPARRAAHLSPIDALRSE